MKTRSTFSEGETPTIFIKRTSTKTDAGERETPLNETGLWAVGALLERANALGSTEPKHYLLPRDHSKETQGSRPIQLGFDPNQHQVTFRTAWRSLTDKAGLKGTRKGDAEISEKHANFFVNHGNATAEDVLYLIRLAQKTVQKKFGINLELEIKTLGFKSEIFES